jgi:hypothetical protein
MAPTLNAATPLPLTVAMVVVRRLRASPNGEVLTTIGNDERLQEDNPSAPGYFLTFIADAVYIQ